MLRMANIPITAGKRDVNKAVSVSFAYSFTAKLAKKQKPSQCEGYVVEKKGLTFGFPLVSSPADVTSCPCSPRHKQKSAIK